jgi:hypothetical protein
MMLLSISNNRRGGCQENLCNLRMMLLNISNNADRKNYLILAQK